MKCSSTPPLTSTPSLFLPGSKFKITLKLSITPAAFVAWKQETRGDASGGSRLMELRPHTTAIRCYVVWWIKKHTRTHARTVMVEQGFWQLVCQGFEFLRKVKQRYTLSYVLQRRSSLSPCSLCFVRGPLPSRHKADCKIQITTVYLLQVSKSTATLQCTKILTDFSFNVKPCPSGRGRGTECVPCLPIASQERDILLGVRPSVLK